MRTPPLIRTLEAIPRVSGIEGFHCNIIIVRYIQYTDIVHTTAHNYTYSYIVYSMFWDIHFATVLYIQCTL